MLSGGTQTCSAKQSWLPKKRWDTVVLIFIKDHSHTPHPQAMPASSSSERCSALLQREIKPRKHPLTALFLLCAASSMRGTTQPGDAASLQPWGGPCAGDHLGPTRAPLGLQLKRGGPGMSPRCATTLAAPIEGN